MASKRHLRRKQCEGKARHTTAAGAFIAIRKLHQKHGHRGQMGVYRCPHCGKYHIGHQPGRNGIGSRWK